MSSPIRPQVAGGVYHITTRGNNGCAIYERDPDRELFLSWLDRVLNEFEWDCYAYCLMTNHYHLVVQTRLANIAEGMCLLNGMYARAFNRRYGRRGHLFERRYHSVLIERQEHGLYVMKYVVLNPVRAGICTDPADHRWSSFAATAGLVPEPRFLDTSWILSQLDPKPETQRQTYVDYVAAGSPAVSLPGLLVLAA